MNQAEKDLIELDRLLASIESKIDKTLQKMYLQSYIISL
jgi:hypothetical protein